MTPQSSFMIAAPIDPRRDGELRALLASMNSEPGRLNPRNAVLPFDRFDTLHFARIVILDDQSKGDIAVYGLEPPSPPLYLVFLGDVDGPGGKFLQQLVHDHSRGLPPIFS